MEIRTEVLKRCVVLSVSGRIDSASAPEFEARLLDLIGEGQRNLVVSMKDVTLISSSGLRALVTAQIKLRRAVPRGDVVLSELPHLVRESMELVGFQHMFQIFDGDLDAVGSF
jgi:anti-anti-sigma factor